MKKFCIKKITTNYLQIDSSHNKPHTGVDISGKNGAKIQSASNGTIVYHPEDPNGFGNRVVIELDNGDFEHYAHLNKPSFLKIGDKVKKGDYIGNVGHSGHCISKFSGNGDHLHYEVRNKNNGKYDHKAPCKDKVEFLNQTINPNEYDC